MDLDWFYYYKAGMLLEESENILELSVTQLVIQSRLASLISLGQAMFVAKLGIFVSSKSFPSVSLI